MKLSQTAEDYYRLRCVQETQEFDKQFNAEFKRIEQFMARGGARKQQAEQLLINRWEKLVAIKIQALLDAYEQDDGILEKADIEEFFHKLESSSKSFAEGWSERHRDILRLGALIEGFRPINIGARNKLHLTLKQDLLAQKREIAIEGKLMYQPPFNKENSFHSYLSRKGIEIRIEAEPNNPMTKYRARALRIDENAFIFPKSTPIEIGFQFQLEGGSDWWHITDKQDEMSRFDGKIGWRVVAERLNADRQPVHKSSQASAVFHGPVIGGVQVGGKHNQQSVSISVNPKFDEAISSLMKLINDDGTLDKYQKEDAVDALKKLPDLAKEEKTEGIIKRAKDKLEIVKSTISISKDLMAMAAPYLPVIAKHFHLLS
jgi:hypothetical protein